jgi:phospholipase/lecithinase/hemolysin
MKKQIVVTGFLLFSFMLPLKATAASFSQIYVFGDSLSDTGNSLKATGNPPSPPYFQGRFSNGLVWSEYLANNLGLTPQQQTNYAFGGANSGRSNNTLVPGLQGLPGLQQQIDSYKATNTSADPNALYVVWAGANDYLSGSTTNPAVPVNNLSTAVNSLADYGAKNIMVLNLSDLGKLPGTRSNIQVSSSLSALSQAHNSGLAANLNLLSQKSNANIIPVDVNSLFEQAIANPQQFNFTNVTNSCLTNTGVCATPDKYLFWDDIHPTTAAHKFVGELAFSTLDSKAVPEPNATLGILTIGALGGLVLHKRGIKV